MINELLEIIYDNIEHSDLLVSNLKNESDALVVYLADVNEFYDKIFITDIKDQPNKYSIRFEYRYKPSNSWIINKETLGAFLRKHTTLMC